MAKKSATKRTKQSRTVLGAAPAFALLPAISATTVRRRRRLRFTFALSVLVFIELLAGASLFAWRQPVTQINLAGLFTGRKLDSKQIAAKLARAEAGYRLPIRYPDASLHPFSLKDMGLAIDDAATLAAARTAQHHGNVLQRVKWWQMTVVPLALRVDEPTFQHFLQSHTTFAATQPQDASLGIENGVVRESDGVDGQNYSLPGSAQLIKTAAAGLNPLPLRLVAKSIPPHINRTQLAEPKKKIEAILSQKVVFAVEGSRTTVPRTTVGAWIEPVPVPDKHTIDITVNSDKVLAYLNQLAATYVRPPRAELVTTASDGAQRVLVAGRDGTDIRGRDALAAAATAQLLQAKDVNIDLPVTHSPHRTVSSQAYPKWIEIDITTKRLYAYEEAAQVREVLVSAGAPGTPTVTGQFAIYSKYRQQAMYGPNTDGSRYYVPDVPYVNYFYRDYAIHGNYWRPASYFGNINSSHGCVGIRDPDSAWIYNWAPIGTPVIVHT